MAFFAIGLDSIADIKLLNNFGLNVPSVFARENMEVNPDTITSSLNSLGTVLIMFTS